MPRIVLDIDCDRLTCSNCPYPAPDHRGRISCDIFPLDLNLTEDGNSFYRCQDCLDAELVETEGEP